VPHIKGGIKDKPADAAAAAAAAADVKVTLTHESASLIALILIAPLPHLSTPSFVKTEKVARGEGAQPFSFLPVGIFNLIPFVSISCIPHFDDAHTFFILHSR
jgi:hypothetical protein